MNYLDKEILNDYEIIDVIRSGEVESRELMIKKYLPLVKKLATKYKFSEYDDMTQHGMMIINIAIDRFDPSYGKTFTRYVQLILIRSFQREYYKKREVVYMDTTIFEAMFAKEEEVEYDYKLKDIKMNVLSKLEKEVLLFYSENKKMSEELIKKHGKKTIYNAFYRSKKKLGKYLTTK